MHVSAKENQHRRRHLSAQLWCWVSVIALGSGCTQLRDVDDFSFRDSGPDSQADAPDVLQRPDARPETCEEACAANDNVLETRCENEECVIDACVSGFVDCDGAPTNGCESTPSECDAFVEVAVAHKHVCARRESGAVDCWGSNEGAVFDDTFLPALSPTRLMVRIPGSDEMREANARSISVGLDHTCFVSAAADTRGVLYCVGAPGSMRVGHSETQDGEPHPVVDGGGPLTARFTRVVSHSLHSCAIDTIGRLWCFGDNRFGQSLLGRNSPDTVVATQNSLAADGVPATVVDVAVGQDHTCAVLDDRTLRCWGRDDVGQTGRGVPSVGAPAVPSPVYHADGELTDVSRVYASKDESCALTNTGELWCWGFNRHESISEPGVQAAAVRVATGVTSVMMFLQSICWAHVDGGTFCRGLREDAQLGSGSREDILEDFTDTTLVPELEGIGNGAGGRYGGCGFRGDQLFCWGYSTHGQVPRDSLIQRTPYPIVDSAGTEVNDLESVVPALNGTCGVADERASCWGFGGASQSGYAESSASSSTPRNVPLIFNVVSVARGDNGACAVSSAPPELWCWGWNASGIIATENTEVPTVVELEPRPLGPIDMGLGHTCALLSDRGEAEVWCWGSNSRGEANGRPGARTAPIEVDLGDTVPTDLTTGRDFSCALAEDGQAFCWGDNSVGQLGREEPDPRPEPVTATRFRHIDAGARHVCGVNQDGAALCWGDNSTDQLGSGATGAFVARPTEVDVPGTVVAVTAGVSSSCAVNSMGEVYCWGDNRFGQLGSEGPSSREPRRVMGVIATDVASGSSMSAHCAGEGGSWWCWGFDAYGQLGTQANLRFPPTLIASE
ncbi:MAG: RCC1 domain-containing protein [Polyangiales bacterium]